MSHSLDINLKISTSLASAIWLELYESGKDGLALQLARAMREDDQDLDILNKLNKSENS